MSGVWAHGIGVMIVLLMLVFIGVWVWAWLPHHRQVFATLARIPLHDGAADAHDDVDGAK